MINDNSITSRRYVLFNYLLMVLVLLVVVWVRIRLLDAPFERDEGEFAYMGQLLLKGIPPYVNAYTMKLPGVSMVYALFMALFGQTPFGVHLGLLVVNALSAALVWLLARRLFDVQTATAATMIYAVLSLSRGVFGVFAHATHFVALFVLAGFVLQLRFLDSRRMYLIASSGLCFGLAVTMKQHAVTMVIFAFLYLLWNGYRQGDSGRRLLSECGLFLLGTAAPLAAIILWVAQAGVFARFWFWTVEYARDYATRMTLIDGLSVFNLQFSQITSFQLPLWLSAAVGGALLLFRRTLKADRLFLFGFLFSAFLAVCPGFYFREHYFVLILVPVALLAGLAVTESANMVPAGAPSWLRHSVPTVLLAAMLGYGFHRERAYSFVLSPVEVSRDIYGENPFPESLVIARYLREHSAPNDRIAVLGSEPQIYFYAKRLSATGYIYMYGLMENQPHAEMMQRDMIGEIEATKPLYLVMVRVRTSWLVNDNSPKELLTWAKEYVEEHYQPVGIADIYPNTTNYLWDGKAAGYEPRSDCFIIVWRRIR